MFQQEKAPKEALRPWQAFLNELFQDDALLSDLAEELGFNPASMARWGRGVVPRNPLRTLKNLVNAAHFPPARREHFITAVLQTYPEFSPDVDPLLDDLPVKEIPSLFYSQIFRSYSYVADELVFWTLSNTICHQLYGHLDAVESGGVSAMLFLCTPPSAAAPSVVRSLYAPIRPIGERPSPLLLRFPICIGNESALSDITPRYNRPLVFNEQELQSLSTPFPPDVKSLALCPIQRRGRFAGCFLVAGQQSEYFTKERTKTVHEYGVLMALAFRDQDFFGLEQFKLTNFPAFSVQQNLENAMPFRHRVENLRDRLEREPEKQTASPNQQQLELLALQELEQELIALRQQRIPSSERNTR